MCDTVGLLSREVVSLTVDHDDDRKIFYLDLADCLRSEILITYNLGFCDAFESSAPAPPMAAK